MDIMRLLTRKLKSQSLEAEEEQEVEEEEDEEEKVEEVEEVEEEEKEAGSEGRRTFPEQRRNNDTTQATEFDSGTASDEDVAEFEDAPPCLHGVEANLHCQVVESQQMDRPTMDPECFSSQPTNATSKSSSNVISPQHVVSSVMMTMPPASQDSGISSSSSSSSSRQSGPAAAALTLASGRLSAVSSDFEWCSLDFDPASLSSCSSEMDQHSSEEELVSIYHHRHHEQKRKHSQMSSPNDNQCTSGEEEDEDAEEELNEEENVEERFHRDCCRPLSSSNCLHGNNRCLHGNHHRCLHGNVGIPISAASDFASPRKRHRQTTTTTSVNSTAIQQQQQQQQRQQRPSLDLYKMQKTSITRKYNNGGCSNIASTNCRPRVVKIRTITGSSRPAKSSAYNPSVFSFRSISWASSRLKEEPFRAF